MNILKKSFCIILMLSMLLCVSPVSAETETHIYINFVRLTTDVEPVIDNGFTYVPFRALSEALGYTVSFDDVTRDVTMEQDDLVIKLTIGSETAILNGEEVTMEATPFIMDGRTMIPVRFVSEAMDCRVDWIPGYLIEYGAPNRVSISSSYPVPLPSENASIAVEIQSEIKVLGVSEDYEYVNRYDVMYPIFSNMKDSEFEKALNDKFQADFLEIKAFADEMYDDQMNNDDGYLWTAAYDSTFTVATDSENLLSLVEDSYNYTGGAHGMPYMTGINIDFKNSKLLTIQDILKEDIDAEQRLIDRLIAIMGENEEEFEYVEKPEELLEYSFYFKDGNLMIFYPPYHLSSYARGFVFFEIPLTELTELLKEEYILA